MRSLTGSFGTRATAASSRLPDIALTSATFGRALGVATADFDGDGWLDI